MHPSEGQQWAELFLCVVVGMGLAVSVVWPSQGPSAVVREILRKMGPKDTKLWDCYVCLGFWTTAAVVPLFGGHAMLSPFLTVLAFWLLIPKHLRFAPSSGGCGGCKGKKVVTSGNATSPSQ